MGIIEGNNNFSVKDSYGTNTLAFVINTTIEDGEEVCSLEKLKCLMERAEDGYKKTFYFNQELATNEKKELAFLTLEAGGAVLRGGEFVNGKVNIGKQTGRLESSAFKVTQNEPEYKEIKYAPNFKRPMTVIDPEIGDEIKPILYLDTETNDVKAKVKLTPNKQYIILEVRNM